MNKPPEQSRKLFEHSIPWLVLAVLLFYSYVDFLQHPFGFAWFPDGRVIEIFVEQPGESLKLGDQLLQVGSLTWKGFRADLGKPFFENMQAGEVAPVVVQRNGETVTVLWRLPGFNKGELWDQLTGQWFLAYFFWIAGLLTVLFLRPKDERWRLLAAFNFLTAIWLIAGSGPSNYHLWYSAVVLRMAIWLCVPVYLHLHWVFPRPLGKLPPMLIWLAYGGAVILAAAQGLQLFSSSLYFLGFLVAVLGSLILLVLHFVSQRDIRHEVRFMAAVAVFAFLPAIALAVSSIFRKSTEASTLAFVSFTAIPFAYLYVAYRRQLGGLEVRTNRLISAYFFIILVGIVILPLFLIADFWIPEHSDLIIGILSALIVSTLSIVAFPGFQKLVEQRLLGIPAGSSQIEEVYSTRTNTSTSIHALVELLRDVMLPSLLVRQFLFVQFQNGTASILLSAGVDETQASRDRLMELKDCPPERIRLSETYPWVRLALPLTVGKDVLGLWLLGRRDPDDFYSEHEMPMLRSLANQTAIALSNILQTNRLHAAFQEDIQSSEKERQRLALELHDGLLNKLAAMVMQLDDKSITPEFQKSYSELTDQIREVIQDLRPALLMYGLQLAIQEYADTLSDRSEGNVQFIVQVTSEGCRYSPEFEQHLFRIVQEACRNALRHAHPTQVIISGQLAADCIELCVQDDGPGFNLDEKVDLYAFQANSHYGITGMLERAELIGADIIIRPGPQKGARVQISWRADKGERHQPPLQT